VVKRAVVVTIGGAAVVVAGLAGCSFFGSVNSPLGGGKLTIDGKDHDFTRKVRCTTMGSTVQIDAGDRSGATVGATVSAGDNPTVQTVSLGNVDGFDGGYAPGTGTATATKGGNSYKITGTAVGVDKNNQMPVNKSFQIDLTCP
jgi:ipoprotein LpqH